MKSRLKNNHFQVLVRVYISGKGFVANWYDYTLGKHIYEDIKIKFNPKDKLSS